MSSRQAAVVAPEVDSGDVFSFDASDVTGTYQVVAKDVQRGLPAKAVARALAARMSLPQNVPWTLLRDSQGAFLDDEISIGEQLSPGEKVTVAPKTHLG